MVKFINSRPIVFLAFFFILGIGSAYYFNLSGELFIWCMFISLLFAVPMFLCKKHFLIGLYITMFFLGGWLFSNDYHTDFSNVNLQEPQQISGKITGADKTSKGFNKYTLSNVKIKEEAFLKKVLLYTKQNFDFGDILQFESKITPPQKARNEGGFDTLMYLASQKAGFSSFSENIVKTGSEFEILKFPYLLRETLAENIDYMYTKETAPFAKAMFLGIKSEIDEDVRESFSITGAAHVLAISGLHIGIIALLLNFLLMKLKLNRHVRFSINIMCLLLYMTITGFSPSVVRAVMMCIFVIIGRWIYANRDTLTFLALSALFALVFNTTQIFTAGFLMSYGAVFGILCLYPPLERVFNKAHFDKVKLSKSLSASLSACSTTLPLTAYYFNGLAFASPLTNFLVIPMATLIVVFTGFSSIISLFFMQLAKFFAFFSQILITVLLEFNNYFSASAFGYIKIYTATIWSAIICFFVVFLASDYVFIKLRVKILIIVVCLAIVLFSFCYAPQSELQITVLDVGDGDIIHIKTSNSDVLLDNGKNAQSTQAYEYTKANEIYYDFVVVTNDKTKNLKNIIIDGYTKLLYTPKNYVAKEYDANISLESFDDIITIDENTYLMLVGSDKKHHSFVLYSKGKPICLFANTNNEEIEVVGQIPIVKLPNKTYEESMEIINTISPRYAIISLKENSHKELYGEKNGVFNNIDVYQTHLNGAITINVDGYNINIKTMR